MNFKVCTLIFLSIILTGCATGPVDYTDIDSNETVIAGHIDVNLIYNRLGVVKHKRTFLPGEWGSITIRKYEKDISDITYSGWESIKFDKNGNLFSPIEPGKYVLEFFVPGLFSSLPGEPGLWGFSGKVPTPISQHDPRLHVANNTLIMDIKPNAINYIGSIQINRIFLSVNQGDIIVFDVGIDDNFYFFKEKVIKKSNNKKIIRSLAEQHIMSDIISDYHILDVAK